MCEEISVTWPVKVVGQYDVVVCGGGSSGIMAAIAAARSGAKTALIEQYGFLGGTATAGMVTPMTDFYKKETLIVGGLPFEFAKALESAGGASIHPEITHGIPFDQELYKFTAQSMVQEAGVQLYLHSYITGVLQRQKRISHVCFVNKSGHCAVEARQVIDCTGDADVAWAAGVPMLDRGGELQPMTLWLKLGGVDTDFLEAEARANTSNRKQLWRIHNRLNELRESTDVPQFGGPWVFTSFHPGIINLNITRRAANSADGEDFTRAELMLRKDAYTLLRLLKSNFREFQDAYILETAVQAASRESRVIKGVYTVRAEDITSRVRFEDSIALGGHCIDVHHAGDSEQSVAFLDAPYHIPYRCMITNEIDNLIVAGRCVSADRQAQATMRVQACCMAEGQAAGCAAALCVQGNVGVREVSIAELQQRLKKDGALL